MFHSDRMDTSRIPGIRTAVTTFYNPNAGLETPSFVIIHTIHPPQNSVPYSIGVQAPRKEVKPLSSREVFLGINFRNQPDVVDCIPLVFVSHINGATQNSSEYGTDLCNYVVRISFARFSTRHLTTFRK